MKKILLILIIITFAGCRSYEKLGDFEYRIQIDSINTGDFEGLIETMKFYHRNNKPQVGLVIKSQKLHFQSNKDPKYSSASLKFDTSNNSLIVIEKFFNGYDKYQHIDSIQRTYKQDEKGNLILIEHKSYKTK